MTYLEKHPESARSVKAPLASAWRTGPTTTRTNLWARCWVLADPFRKRRCTTSPVLACVANTGSKRAAGVAVGGALLVSAVHFIDRGVEVDGHGRVLRTGAHGPGARQELFSHRVELAHVTEGEAE